jgi:hypothetical protein
MISPSIIAATDKEKKLDFTKSQIDQLRSDDDIY